jgi:hypothetical protein
MICKTKPLTTALLVKTHARGKPHKSRIEELRPINSQSHTIMTNNEQDRSQLSLSKNDQSQIEPNVNDLIDDIPSPANDDMISWTDTDDITVNDPDTLLTEPAMHDNEISTGQPQTSVEWKAKFTEKLQKPDFISDVIPAVAEKNPRNRICRPMNDTYCEMQCNHKMGPQAIAGRAINDSIDN